MRKLSILLLPLLVVPFFANCGNEYYHFRFDGEHCAIHGEPNYQEEIVRGSNHVQFTVVPDRGYSIDYAQSEIPEGVSFENAVITIPTMNNDYQVSVKTIATEYHFVFSGQYCTIRNSAGHEVTELDELIPHYTSKTYQLTPRAGYELPIGEIQPGIHLDRDGKLTIARMEKSYTVDLAAHTLDTAMEITVDVEDNEQIGLICSGDNIRIDWGDGNDTTNGTHTYLTGGVYTIQVHGTLDNFKIITAPGGRENTSVTRAVIYRGDKIFNSMFADCVSLETIILSDSIETIGDNAFDGCTSLTNLTISSSVKTIGLYSIANCTALSSITIPQGVTTIESCAFFNCIGLTSLFIPDTVTTIEPMAFTGCSSLTALVVDENNTHYSSRNCNAIIQDVQSVYYDITIEPDTLLIACNNTKNLASSGIKHICGGAFYDCEEITSLDIPEGVISIGDSAFYGCLALSNVHLPTSLETIDESAFYGCISLESINLSDKIITIPTECFAYCVSLSEIAIPDSVQTIKREAFAYCTSLTAINLPKNLVTIESFAIRECPLITSIFIPASVSSIGAGAIIACNNLTSLGVDIDNATYRSRNNAIIHDDPSGNVLVCGCNGTDGIPDKVQIIGERAFYGTNFERIKIPAKITNINKYAFFGCSNLEIVDLTDFASTSHVPQIGAQCFDSCSDSLQFYFSDAATLNKFAETDCWKAYQEKFTTDPIPSC